MVLALIIFISLFLIWVMISPSFEILGKFIKRKYRGLFNNNEGDKEDEKR